jgi:transposase
MSKLKLESKKSTKLNIRQKRVFSEEFKREKVQELNAGLYSISSCGSPPVCKLWDVTSPAVYGWIYLYSPEHKKGTTMVVQKDSEAQRTSDLVHQVAELERCLGQKQMQLDYLEKLVELACKEYEIDFKKNFNVQR